MLSKLALTTLRGISTRVAPIVARNVAPTAAKAATFRLASMRFFSSEKPFAVDAPDGDHDLQDVEESADWAKRTVEVASITEDANAINQVHDAVLGSKVFAVDAPDGEHDLEDVEEHLTGVNAIIEDASLFENPEEVLKQQNLRKETLQEQVNTAKHDL
mmetsp:Transcript_14541/g.30596  ORF Transcript_14541/g.30596 Transcript_14541/m.30596 type:complete len:159 (+) Transcript_14541:152-628(+)|eukprot:CAMPEP_0171347774 /NCGR_PEP_ID=MMETSP0878-20121228/28963_1 /TAXON_ID=67004 /ORGANISM="Thalassiosira weissflogii, Strain CCMP1336" /LENGTH=158 /DNA_ID=CAMNT_0011851915 /DNA_START=135 /DNA_END=611 /DNA_ORIENTATION=-